MNKYDTTERAVRRRVRKEMRSLYGRNYSQDEYENAVEAEMEFIIPDKLENMLYGERDE